MSDRGEGERGRPDLLLVHYAGRLVVPPAPHPPVLGERPLATSTTPALAHEGGGVAAAGPALTSPHLMAGSCRGGSVFWATAVDIWLPRCPTPHLGGDSSPENVGCCSVSGKIPLSRKKK